jgi:hypothetical protein
MRGNSHVRFLGLGKRVAGKSSCYPTLLSPGVSWLAPWVLVAMASAADGGVKGPRHENSWPNSG